MTFEKLSPLRTLRLRVGLLVLGVIAALAVFTTQYFSERLTNSYREAGRAQLGAIASLWDDSFRLKQLRHPEGIQRRINALREKNETLHKLSVSWHDPSGGTWLVQSGHEHDPDGTKRDVTGAVTVAESLANPAPIDERNFRYHEVNATDGAHYGELNYPLHRFRDGRRQLVGALELHYDLKQLDQSLAADKRTLTIASALAAVTAALLISLLLSRAVLSPLDRLRAATRRIGGGEVAARLNWKRADEIGALARDFDRMAAELETAHGHLEELALTDPLTGLLNHRAFQERMRQELRRAEREAYAVSVVALDVDHFKQINDRWGHAAGDQVLRALATSIRGELRPSDVCGRVGGDEFMLAIARAGFERTEQIIDRLRERIASMQFGPAGERVTLSVGISEFSRHSLSQEELMHLADGAMYWAKSNGRNRTFVYTSDSDFALSAQEAADRVAREGLITPSTGWPRPSTRRTAIRPRTPNGWPAMPRSSRPRWNSVTSASRRYARRESSTTSARSASPTSCCSSRARSARSSFRVMRRHSELGRDIIAGAGLDDIGHFVLHLHERWDGRGYPHGVAGDEIPLESRILHVADALEAMTSSRVYRKPLPLERALDEIEKHAGTQFDPELAELMVALVRSGRLEVGNQEEQESLDVLSLRGSSEGALAPSEGHGPAGDYVPPAGGFIGGVGAANGNGTADANGAMVALEEAATPALEGRGNRNGAGHGDGETAPASAAVGDARAG